MILPSKFSPSTEHKTSIDYRYFDVSHIREYHFKQKIDDYYGQLIKTHAQKNFLDSAHLLLLFVEFDQTHYRNISYVLTDTILHIEKQVMGIPQADAQKNLKLYTLLSKLAPNNSRYKSKVEFYTAQAE